MVLFPVCRGLLLVLTLLSLFEGVARASDPAIPVAAAPLAPAPGLALPMARRHAGDVLRGLVEQLSPAMQRKVTGIYVASDATSRDAYAMAACDDDGDYVVVLSDPMLTLLDYVAGASANDETAGTHKLSELATFVGRNAHAGARLLAPPAGFFEGEDDDAKAELAAHRFTESLAGVLAHELAHATSDLQCGAPTATHERGDDVWTSEERAAAFAIAPLLTTSARVAAADRAASSLLAGAKVDARGLEDWLTFVDAVLVSGESASAGAPGPLPVYVRLHARARTRGFRAP
jgi:hypothetical protein